VTQRRVTTSEASQLLDVPAARIRAWTARRQVTPIARTAKSGHHASENVYNLPDLVVLAQRYHANRRVTTAAVAGPAGLASPQLETPPSPARPS